MRNLNLIPLMLVAAAVFVFTGCEEEEANKKPIISITNPASGTSIPKDTTITISAEAEDEDGKLKEVRFYLDGTDIGSASSTPYNYEWDLRNVSTGTHSLQAEAIDAENATAQDTIQITVGELPNAAFEVDKTDITVDGTVNFENKSTGNPTSWEWGFGDGSTSTEASPSHTYNSAGSYTVELTVTNDYGSDTETKTDYITVESGSTDGTVTDIDGNVYNTVVIGNQEWMAENLKTTTYNNGTSIDLVTNNTAWENNTAGAYCWYDNDQAQYAETYGALYNGYAMETGNLCPDGWHVPTDEEWKTLEMALGMSQADADETGYRGTNEGSKLAGNAALWDDGNLENDSEFGSSEFTALPGGLRNYNGEFKNIGSSGSGKSSGNWWSATEYGTTRAWTRDISYNYSGVIRRYYESEDGFSVRCVRD